MQFSSAVFLILFLPVVLLLYFICGTKGRWYKNTVLLLASLFFYAWGEPLFILIMIVSIAANYAFGLLMEHFPARKKVWLVCSVILNLGVLIVFKYLTFILRNLSAILPVPLVQIALPIGISFYTFQIMSYVFDVYFGTVSAQRNPIALSLYITMFPQLVAGPIVRYSTIAHEIHHRRETFHDFSEGLIRFVFGLAKKVLVADFLAGVADQIFTNAKFGPIPAATAWLGALAYTFEIYYDFSGYSDMAIGLGRCFGFHFLENFNYPYMARSITDFWRRWHISLTSFFRDYVYIPLGGNRVSLPKHIRNLFIVWLLTGIWHGAEWTFILWGIVYFAIQLLEKQTGLSEKLPSPIAHCYTMMVVVLCWVLFRAENLRDALSYFHSMFSVRAGFYDVESLQYLKSSFFVLVVAIVGSIPVWKRAKSFCDRSPVLQIIYELIRSGMAMIYLICSILLILNGSYSPFIYFNF